MAINSITGNTLLNGGSFSPCRVASTGSPLTPATGGLLVVDGIQLIAGDRVLCKDETSAVNNGIYAANTGPWVRTTDAISNTQFFDGMKVTVAAGAVNGGLDFICTTTDDPVVVGTSLLTFASQATVASGQQSATSTTSLAIGTGSKTLTIQSGKAFLANQWVLIQETSNAANQMLGKVTSYGGTSLVVNVTATGGSGTHADWTIVLTNSAAAAGYQPPVGSGNVTGPGSSTAGHIATYADGTGQVLLDGGAPVGAANTVTPMMLALASVQGGFNMLNGTLTATPTDSNTSLTIAVKTLAGNDPSASDPVFFLFRSATAGSASYSMIEVTAALSTKIPASSTMGFSNATPGRVWVLAINNGGAVSLAVVNALSGTNIFPLAGWGIANVTAYGGGANSAQVIYGTSTVANLPYSVLGFLTYEAGSTLATAGTWATAPSRMELYRPGVSLPGQEVQRLRSTTGAVATGTTASSVADSVPTSSQGDQYMSQAVTPASSANILEIGIQAILSNSNNVAIIGALLQDSVANALIAADFVQAGAASESILRLDHEMLAATLSATTFKFRAGGTTGNATTFNGRSGARQLGGAYNSYIRIREIMA